MPVSTLAERVGVSRSNATNRLEQLEARGVVLGFHAQVDSGKIGVGATAVVFLKVEPHGWPEFRQAIAELPEVEYACVTTGGWDALVFVRAESVQALHVLIAGVIAALPSVIDVLTHLIIDEIVRRPFVLPDELSDRSDARERLGIGPVVRGTPPARTRPDEKASE